MSMTFKPNPDGSVDIQTNSVTAATITPSRNLLVGLGTDVAERLAVDGRVYLTNQGSPATPVNGGVIYVEGGALKYKGSSGTVTVIGPA